MKNKILAISGLSMVLIGCNNNIESSQSSQLQSKQADTIGLVNPAQWSIDGVSINQYSPASKMVTDSGWHLLTLTIPPNPGAPVLSIQGIGGALPPNQKSMGQNVQIQDINCGNAQIPGSTGGSCSVYIRFAYDPAKAQGQTQIPFNGVQISALNPDVPALLYFSPAPLVLRPTQAAVSVRNVQPFETAYLGHTTGNINYQTLLVLNNSESTITSPNISVQTIYAPSNSNFTLVTRSSNADDPVYGTNQECQQNMTLAAGAYCTLTYKAAPTITYTGQTTISATELSALTTAVNNFPNFESFTFIASYVQNTPNIPSQTINGASMTIASGSAHAEGTSMVADLDGTKLYSGVSAANNFYQMGITYNIEPSKKLDYDITPNYEYGTQLTIPYFQIRSLDSNEIYNGEPLLLALNNGAAQYNSFVSNQLDNPITKDGAIIGSVNVSNPSDSHQSSVSATVTLTNHEDYYLNKNVQLDMTNFYNGTSASFSGVESLVGSNNSLDSNFYNSGTWNNRVTGSYSSSPDKSWNPILGLYIMTVSTYGVFNNLGCGSPCAVGNNGTGTININPNLDYNVYLSQSLPAPTSFIAKGGQAYSAAIGSQSGVVNPNISITPNTDLSKGYFSMNGNYSNGQSANNSSFAIVLNKGDQLDSTNLTFTPSIGYVLSTYTSSANQ